jgi:hypothetical protein
MAYDPVLAERVREELARQVDFTERKMFGGLSFLVNGNMCCGITGNDPYFVFRQKPPNVPSKCHTQGLWTSPEIS